MNAQEIEQQLNTLPKNDVVGFVKFVLSAMRDQRRQDARLIKEYADQLPGDHPARPYLYELSDTLFRQSGELQNKTAELHK